VPFAAPGAPACAALAPFVLGHDAVLIANHGVLTWGADAEQAYLRMELVEHLARIALAAAQAGGVKPLPESAVGPLLEARRKAGLGLAASAPPAAHGAPRPTAVVACAPSPTADVAVISPGRQPEGDLVKIIREEIVRSLKS
jgi:L-fuculose-phosphate aldolase